MFVIAFDLTTADVKANHPRSSRQAYLDIERTLEKYGFERAKTTINSIIFVLSIAFTLGYIVYLFPILPHNEIAKSINNVIFSSWRII